MDPEIPVMGKYFKIVKLMSSFHIYPVKVKQKNFPKEYLHPGNGISVVREWLVSLPKGIEISKKMKIGLGP